MSKAPPRLVARTLTVTFITVAVILSVVFIVLTVDVRDRVRNAESEKLRVSERVFTALEARRQQEQLDSIATLAENPTLKAALDTYFTEGYPFGLHGAEIPLLARIVHVADAFDAMTSARAYRRAPGVEVALAELRLFKGTQFDPATVEALEAALPDTLAELHLEPELQLILGRERA